MNAQQKISNEYSVEARDIRKTFKDFWGRPKVEALKGVNLIVRRGDVYALLGPNGAGKSTLLKCLLGHLFPTSGVLRVMGESPRSAAVKAHMGYLPEQTAFWGNLTAHETLRFFGKLNGLSKAECDSRITQLLEMTGIAHAADRACGEFSHGMRKRLGLSLALLNDPELLILDEPTAGMDPLGCREVKDLILSLAKRGKTVILTSHLLSDVQDVCSQVAILYGGKVLTEGSLSELLKNKNEWVLRANDSDPTFGVKMRECFEAKWPGVECTVTPGERSLENLFLDVIGNARAQQDEADASGAHAGSGVAEYLSPGEAEFKTKNVIRHLARESISQTAEELAVAEALKRAELADLSERDKNESEADNVDRGVLDALTKK